MQTPRYEYSKRRLSEKITYLQNLALPYGYTLRYAVKANPFPQIITMMHEAGVHFDASSSYEACELIAQGIPPEHISLSSQQSAHTLQELVRSGVLYVATSLHQLDQYVALVEKPLEVAVRINPEFGQGHNKRTNTGGVNSSFGIWHEYIPEVLQKTAEAGIRIHRLHMHIGSGADPRVWEKVIDQALATVLQFPDVEILDIGGGFKVHRYGDEKEADMELIAKMCNLKLIEFLKTTGRKIHLEIEPGTYFIAHAGVLVAHIDDIVATGKEGYTFLRLNTGMNDFLRSTLYGAQHRIAVINNSIAIKKYVVVGHNCESGDILTPVLGNPEEIEVRELAEAHIGDEVRIYDCGAYCASMRARGYNSFPDALEVMVD